MIERPLLAIVGLAELILRIVFLLVFSISTFFIGVLIMVEDGNLDIEDFLSPICWEML